MTITTKIKENYNKDKANFILVKTSTGYNVTNMRTFKMYEVTKNNGKFSCTCPDFIYRRSDKDQGCKHCQAVIDNEMQKLIARW